VVVDDIKVFVPSKSFALSKEFYAAFGFELVYDSDEYAEFRNNDCSFILQNYYHNSLAKNLMIQLVVSSVDEVYAEVNKLLDFGIKLKPPEIKGWGKLLYLWGPSGELWHITEFN